MKGRIVFTEHAKYQLAERTISETAVRLALKRPAKVIEQPSGRNRAVRRLTKDGRKFVLVVVYENTPTETLVITAFMTSKITKYL